MKIRLQTSLVRSSYAKITLYSDNFLAFKFGPFCYDKLSQPQDLFLYTSQPDMLQNLALENTLKKKKTNA